MQEEKSRRTSRPRRRLRNGGLAYEYEERQDSVRLVRRVGYYGS